MVAAARVLQIISVWMTMRCYAHSKAKSRKKLRKPHTSVCLKGVWNGAGVTKIFLNN